MVTQGTEDVATIDTAEITDHNCPYLDHVGELSKHAGSDLRVRSMGAFVRFRIAAIHVDGEYPPTHKGGPTSPGTV